MAGTTGLNVSYVRPPKIQANGIQDGKIEEQGNDSATDDGNENRGNVAGNAEGVEDDGNNQSSVT